MPVKEWKPVPMRGAGDLVEAVTRATGIKAAVDAASKVTGRDCGCRKRREALNRLLPFGKDRPDGVQPEQA